MSGYASALGLTLVIELPVYLVGLMAGARRHWREALALGLGVNLVSHPLAFLVVDPLLEHVVGAAAALVVTELGVVLVEAAMLRLRRVSTTVALAASAGANIASLALGVAITR